MKGGQLCLAKVECQLMAVKTMVYMNLRSSQQPQLAFIYEILAVITAIASYNLKIRFY